MCASCEQRNHAFQDPVTVIYKLNEKSTIVYLPVVETGRAIPPKSLLYEHFIHG